MNIHVEWGIKALNAPSDVTIIVDALSFSTAISVAVSKGAKIYPFYFKDQACQFASKLGVKCAQKRDTGGISLSPSSLSALNIGDELVLPSPNGATLTMFAKSDIIIAACLRNAKAVAQYVNQLGVKKINLVAAGERWHDHDRPDNNAINIEDNSLRPAFEDFITCGAIATYLEGDLTPEAFIAKASFKAVKPDLLSHMLACLSGQELIARGFEIDVIWASMLNSDKNVPLLQHMPKTYQDYGIEDHILKEQSIKFYKAI